MFTVNVWDEKGNEYWLEDGGQLTYHPKHFSPDLEFPLVRCRMGWEDASRLAYEMDLAGWDRVEIVQLERPEFHLDPA